jgi:hypothetical protein
MKHIKEYDSYLNEASKKNDYLVAKELAKIAKMDVDRADNAVQSFLKNAQLNQMREYWGASSDKAAAGVVKKHWLDENLNEAAYELDYNTGSSEDSVIVSNAIDDTELAEISAKGKITWLVKSLPTKIKKQIEADAAYHIDTLNESLSGKLAPKISKAISEIDDSMSYSDFAGAVAQVLREDYGSHNYEGFITELKKNLK